MESLAEVEAYWTDYAEAFDDEPDHGLTDPTVRDAWAERLASWLPTEPGRVADLGCGTGSLSILAAEQGAKIAGMDLSAAMIEIARDKAAAAGHRIDFHVGDVSEPPMANRSFDVILCRHLLWTLPDPVATLQRWSELLQDDGRLVLIEGVWATSPAPKNERQGQSFPWRGGIPAATLIEQVGQLFRDVEHHSLSDSPELWGKSVNDERYAIVASGIRLKPAAAS